MGTDFLFVTICIVHQVRSIFPTLNFITHPQNRIYFANQFRGVAAHGYDTHETHEIISFHD